MLNSYNPDEKIVCAVCKKEIPFGFMTISYDNKVFDNYRCLAVFKGVNLDGSSLSNIMDESTLLCYVALRL